MWQPDVYRAARSVAQRLNATAIRDFGCGMGTKLAELAEEFPDVLGLDLARIVEKAAAARPDLNFAAVDLDKPHAVAGLTDAVAIASDVLEHLVRPGYLLQTLAMARAVVLSTPDRIRTYGYDHNGPPANQHHVREWSREEFAQLVQTYLGATHDCELGHTRSNDVDNRMNTLIAVCIRKPSKRLTVSQRHRYDDRRLMC